ncbi:sigma-70 family RNA polymerase sigma factor [Pelagibius sp. Alg239-R121]|uniref:sigma-70 family RNA polymerase sigma factor n=1 Tax=Pelagibius sp. Alg239-R121 TaxID=2993448 RepID=UPI0024A65F5E|nr:sigma-70 family RNA polymerase sigma factor [Pelagibius sp. Alg239-R121]
MKTAITRPVALFGSVRSLAAFAIIASDGAMTQEPTAKETRPSEPLTAPELVTFVSKIAEQRCKTSFQALFGYFAPRLKAYLMRLGSDADQAEELVQEAMIMVWRKAASFDASQAAVSTWIFTIARNKRIDAIRREKRPEIDLEDPALVPQSESLADDIIEEQQDARRLKAAISRLSSEQATLIKMAYFGDKAHGAIAEETGLPLGTVKSRLRLALGHLRKELKEGAP